MSDFFKIFNKVEDNKKYMNNKKHFVYIQTRMYSIFPKFIRYTNQVYFLYNSSILRF